MTAEEEIRARTQPTKRVAIVGEAFPEDLMRLSGSQRSWLVMEFDAPAPSVIERHMDSCPGIRIDSTHCYVKRSRVRKLLRELDDTLYEPVTITIPEEIDAVLPPRLIHEDGAWAPRFAPNLLELALLRSVKRPNTIRSYLNAAHNFCKFAGREPAYWTGYKVVEWREALKTMPVERPDGNRKPMTMRSINAKLAAIRFACKRAVALGLIKDDFARAAEFLPYIFEKTRYARPIEVAGLIFAACQGEDSRSIRDRAVVVLGFYHGLRRESLAAMRFEDVDRDSRTVKVIIKGGRRHTVPLDPRGMEALDEWVAVLARKFQVRSGPLFRRVTSTVKGEQFGERALSGNSIYNIVVARSSAAGVEDFHPHLMRHCFISWAIANGHTIEQIMLVTGHRSPKSIVEYLSEVRGANELPRGLIPTL